MADWSGGPAGAGRAPAVELAGLARRFGRRWALRGVDLRVEPGEAVALVGRNGSGKTTLLRVIATLLRPTRGLVRVAGMDVVREAAAVREHVGMMGHAPGVYDDLTATENLRFALRMMGRAADADRIADALAWVGLAAEAHERVRTFSSGMRRRLVLARLRLQQPSVLLLDEPYASFDADGVELLNAFIRETADRGGAVVVATHDLARGERVLERVVSLDAGRVVSAEAAARVASTAAEPAAGREAMVP